MVGGGRATGSINQRPLTELQAEWSPLRIRDFADARLDRKRVPREDG